MPTYEYQCLDCKHKVEYFQRMTEAPRTLCPRCHGKLVRLVSSGAGLIFKGSGFYITDYKKKEDSFKSRARNGNANSNKETDKSKQTDSNSKVHKSLKTTEAEKTHHA